MIFYVSTGYYILLITSIGNIRFYLERKKPMITFLRVKFFLRRKRSFTDEISVMEYFL